MRVVTVGAGTVDRYYHVASLPQPDGGAFARDVTERFGGVAANVAYGVATLGERASLVTRLGEGEIGDRVACDLREGPVDTARVRRGPERSTHCVILSAADGTRSIVTAGESCRALRLDEDDRAYLADADAVFVTAYAPDPVHERLLSWAGPEFPPVAFDLSGPRSELAGRGASPESVERWIETAELFVVGRVAAESAFGCAGRDAARVLRDRGVRRAAVTDGENGATLVRPPAAIESGGSSANEFGGSSANDSGGSSTNESGRSSTNESGDESSVATSQSTEPRLIDVPAYEVAVEDETGAGDAYVAGLLTAWLGEGRPAAAAGRFAASAAALNCTATGARGGLATREEVESLVADRDE